MGTFVNNDFTSKLIIISSSSNFKSFNISTKCVEFFTYESVLPAKGDIQGGYDKDVINSRIMRANKAKECNYGGWAGLCST